MDPLPSVNKSHSLFIQEEMQRSVTNSVRVESTVLAAKSFNNNPKGKDRPLCTHCGKLGHTVEKCYKLHGFPPGYKFKNKNMMAHQVSAITNQFQNHCLTPNIDHNPVANQFQGHCLVPNSDYNHAATTQAPAFTPDQYQQLLSLIGVHQPSTVQEPHMVNAISLASNAVAGIVSCSPHSVFSAKVMNRKAFGIET